MSIEDMKTSSPDKLTVCHHLMARIIDGRNRIPRPDGKMRQTGEEWYRPSIHGAQTNRI